MSRPVSRDWEALRALLAADAILEGTESAPIRHRDGTIAPWMFYSWNITMTAAGLDLAARCLLERLADFETSQLCAHGMTGLPLLAACLRLGDGRYSGIAVRKERKDYLSGRRVEGPLDRTLPVVIVDDSLSSGTALAEAIRALESEGAAVEGAVAMVNFAGRGGLEAAVANGYRVEVLFDMEHDLGRRIRPLPRQLLPARSAGHPPLPETLHPASLARLTARHYLTHGNAPVAPRSIAGKPDGRGGVFVSFRRRTDNYRLARDGFWHFDPTDFDAARDVVDATIRTIRTSGRSITTSNLADLKIAVSFLGPLEAMTPAGLDFDRWAIVVRDDAGTRAGGALPNTQVFTSEIEQYLHAWRHNAQIGSTEPHQLLRQSVAKVVEEGESWPTYGTADDADLSWVSNQTVGAILGRYARSRCVVGSPSTPSPADDLLATPIDGIAVTLYRGRTLGSAISWGSGPLAELIADAASRAANGVSTDELSHGDLVVAVTVLFGPEHLGSAEPSFVARKVRKGLDALRVDCAAQTATLLPGALVYNGWTEQQFVDAATRRVRQGRARPRYTTYRTAIWHQHNRQCCRVQSGFSIRSDEPAQHDVDDDIRNLVGFILRNQGPRGLPLYMLNMVTGDRSWNGTGPRQLHALMGLERAGRYIGNDNWCAAALAGFRTYLENGEGRPGGFAARYGGPLADAIAVAAMGVADHPLAQHTHVLAARERLLHMIQPNGRITAAPVRFGRRQDIEFLPGAVLTALATDPHTIHGIPPAVWRRCLAWHGNQFRVLRRWGQVGWLTQGWAAVWATRRADPEAAFVFEVADWACDRQLDKNGAFLEELSPSEPSFNTGFIAEGIAAAWRVADAMGDHARSERYEASWRAANKFMRTLEVSPTDTFCSPDADAVVGGVRLTVSSPVVRADSVSHWLNALVAGASM